MSKKIPITNLHHFTDWSAMQSENSSIRFDFSSKIHSARAAQTAWQNRSERCWKMDDQRPSNAWTRFALGDLGGISSPKKIITVLQKTFRPRAWHLNPRMAQPRFDWLLRLFCSRHWILMKIFRVLTIANWYHLQICVCSRLNHVRVYSLHL